MMMNDQMVLEEDDNFEATEEQVLEYADFIGIDVKTESHLLWVAREGVVAPLPAHWKPCKDPKGEIYYFNFKTGDSSWNHPSDDHYINMVLEERKKTVVKKNTGNKHTSESLGLPMKAPDQKSLSTTTDTMKSNQSLNTTTDSLKSNQSLNMTNNVVIPADSIEASV